MSNRAEYNYDVFISYAEADRAWVEGYLLDALGEAGVRCHSEAAFALGAPRLLEFERAIQRSRRTLLVLSPAYLSDESNQFIDLLAQSYGLEMTKWPVIPLILRPVKLPPRLAMLTSLDATDSQRWSDVIERLCHELQRPVPEPPPRLACPYPGMVPFSARDARFFYGREAEIQQMLRHLRHQRFLFIIGSSGSGKSSLVIAGLLPRLQESTFFPPGFWLVRMMRPGSQPLQTLSQIVGADLAQPALALSNLLAAHPPAQRLLLVLDQFEELFTQASRSEQTRFIITLQDLRAIESCALVMALRADFYSDLMSSDLWPVAPTERLEIAPLRGPALRDAIAKPAERQRIYLDAGLVERLLADAANEPGVLPLVQETMVQLWDRMERRLIPQSAYEQLSSGERSGLAVAVVTKADATLAQLSPQGQAIARRIFLRLVQFGEGRADTRRQQSVSALHAGADDPHMFDQTLRHLTDNRLLTLSGEETDTDKKVDIAHEALFTGWPTLQGWLSARREAEQTRRRLEAKAAEWVHLGRGRSGLLDDVELREAENWLKSFDAADLGYDETLPGLVRASRAAIEEAEREKEAARQRQLQAAQKLAQAERQRAETERKARLRGRRFTIGLFISLFVAAILLCAAIATSFFAIGQSNARATAEAQAVAERDVAVSRELAASAVSQLPVDPELSLLLAMEAVAVSNTAQARAALRQSLLESHLRAVLRGQTHFITSLAFSPDGRFLLTSSKDKTARVWDIAEGKPVAELRGHTGFLTSALFSSDGELVVTASQDGTARVWEATTGKLDANLQVDTDVVWRAVFSRDGKFVITVSSHDHYVRTWELSTNRLVAEMGGAGNGLVSSDGTFAVTTNDDGMAQIWEASTGQLITELRAPSPVYGTVFSPDGKFLLTTSKDKTVRVWDTGNGELLAELDGDIVGTWTDGHGGYENTMRRALSPDGNLIVTLDDDKTPLVWEVSTGKLLSKLEADQRTRRITDCVENVSTGESICEEVEELVSVQSALFSPNGKLVVTEDGGEMARVWEVNTGRLVAELPGDLPVWSPDGNFVVTHGRAKAYVWEVSTGELEAELYGRGPEFLSLATFSPDGKFVITEGSDDTLRLWDWQVKSKIIRCGPLDDHLSAPAALSSDGRFVVTLSYDKIGRVCDTSTGEVVTKLTGTAGGRDGEYVALSHESKFVFIIDDKERAVRVWEVSTGELVAQLPGYKAAFSADGAFVGAAGSDETAKVCELSTGKITELTGLTGEAQIDDVAFSPDGGFIGAVVLSKPPRVWEASTGKLVTELKGYSGRAYRIVFSPDSKSAVTANLSDDGMARIWEVSTGNSIHELRGHSSGIRSVTYSPDGKLVATASDDRTARVWEARTGKLVSELSQHTQEIYSVAFSPDGRFMVTASSDGTARVWETSTGAAVAVLPKYTSFVRSAAFSPDGMSLYTTSWDGRVQIYACEVCVGSIEELLALARKRVTRELSREERRTYLHED